GGVDVAPYRNDTGQWTRGGHFSGKHEKGKNDLRLITSRKHHQLIFNDNADEPRVALTSSQKHRIVLDDNPNATQIEIFDGKEQNYILTDTKNKKITIETKSGDMLLKAAKKLPLEADEIETKPNKNTTVTAGMNFSLSAKVNMELKATAQGTVQATGPL